MSYSKAVPEFEQVCVVVAYTKVLLMPGRYCGFIGDDDDKKEQKK